MLVWPKWMTLRSWPTIAAPSHQAALVACWRRAIWPRKRSYYNKLPPVRNTFRVDLPQSDVVTSQIDISNGGRRGETVEQLRRLEAFVCRPCHSVPLSRIG